MFENNLQLHEKNNIATTLGNITGFILRMILWFVIFLNYLFKKR